jgi:hypothetical protein
VRRSIHTMKMAKLKGLFVRSVNTVTRDEVAEMSTRELRELPRTAENSGVAAVACEEIALREKFMADTSISICPSDHYRRG